jgi:sRNA-binding protein
LWQHRHRKAYLKKLVRGGPRYDLQGNTKGEVTEREREEAKRQLVDTGLTRSRRHAAGALNPSPQEVVPH